MGIFDIRKAFDLRTRSICPAGREGFRSYRICVSKNIDKHPVRKHGVLFLRERCVINAVFLLLYVEFCDMMTSEKEANRFELL